MAQSHEQPHSARPVTPRPAGTGGRGGGGGGAPGINNDLAAALASSTRSMPYEEPALARIGGSGSGGVRGASGRPGWAIALDVVAPIVRLTLAALFIFGGLVKLGWTPEQFASGPEEFATSIRKYRLLDYQLVPWAAFAVPWIELVGGVALLLGLMARGAATLLLLLLGMLTGGILLVMFRGIEISECSCFGGQMIKIFGEQVGEFLESPVGWTSVLRNLIFMTLLLFIAGWGSGYFGFDRLVRRRD